MMKRALQLLSRRRAARLPNPNPSLNQNLSLNLSPSLSPNPNHQVGRILLRAPRLQNRLNRATVRRQIVRLACMFGQGKTDACTNRYRRASTTFLQIERTTRDYPFAAATASPFSRAAIPWSYSDWIDAMRLSNFDQSNESEDFTSE